MAVRTLDQIIGELGSIYNPQMDLVRQRQQQIPGQIQAEEQGLQAKQESAFGDILSGARRRGLGFAGIPLQEQAKYTATEFLPAIARLRQQGKEQAMSLEEALLGINERRNTLGTQLRQQDVDNDYRERAMAEEQRRFNEQMALQREQEARAARGSGGGFAPTFGGGTVAGAQAPKASYSLKNPNDPGQGFSFRDAQGKTINALQYAQATGVSLQEVVNRMAQAGDRGAAAIRPFVQGNSIRSGVISPSLIKAFIG